jgi:hypothetical protein
VFNGLKGPKKLVIGSGAPMQPRPWVEEHDEMFRWHEYWLKGVDNWLMDEPAVSVFVSLVDPGEQVRGTGADRLGGLL